MEKKLNVLGIDIAKQVFHLVGMNEHGTILLRKRLYRAQVMAFIAQLGISKHGDSYLRKLLVHGARSCLRWVGRKRDRRSQWVQSLMERRGWNKAAVALANKNARVAWALMGTEQVYRVAEA
jgi:hypothetical protein